VIPADRPTARDGERAPRLPVTREAVVTVALELLGEGGLDNV
jgi:hypothetical protein